MFKAILPKKSKANVVLSLVGTKAFDVTTSILTGAAASWFYDEHWKAKPNLDQASQLPINPEALDPGERLHDLPPITSKPSAPIRAPSVKTPTYEPPVEAYVGVFVMAAVCGLIGVVMLKKILGSLRE